ncbi:MAG: hypothetical protein KGH71_04785 [Candidatus Micrarchaeota archaeon]|nr:hypothetical protein [Candidatus Micrarchaeota archaeon]
MQKISLLIFSINEPSQVVSLAKEMYRLVDDIVVIDSSDRKNLDRLEIERRKNKLEKMNVFHTVALGYAEPYREYGISKCKNNWILLLDTDEKLSVHLRMNLRRIVDNADFDVLKIKRYEHVGPKGVTTSYYTWQVRLFKKGSVRFLGLTHETPEMIGTVKALESETEYLNHLDELRHKRFYNKMDLFSANGAFVLIVRDLIVGAMNGEMNLDYLLNTFKTQMGFEDQRRKDPSIIEIGKIIEKKGLIKYLQLDKESVIKKLEKKYAGKRQGIDLLIQLLSDKYNN